MIGGVGQRVLVSVAKKTAGEFFSAVDDVLNGRVAEVPTAGLETAPGLFQAPTPAARPAMVSDDFMRGAVFGAVIALLGALVGGWVARRGGRR
jgi:hypothetical protein